MNTKWIMAIATGILIFIPPVVLIALKWQWPIIWFVLVCGIFAVCSAFCIVFILRGYGGVAGIAVFIGVPHALFLVASIDYDVTWAVSAHSVLMGSLAGVWVSE